MSDANGVFYIGTVAAEGQEGFQPRDPGLGWVPVKLGNAQTETYWARMVLAYATKETGMAVYPEVGDQVVVLRVGREYFCLGVVYTKSLKAKVSNDEGNKYGKNFIKEFRTPAGTGVTINDEKDKEYMFIDVKSGGISVRLDVGEKSIIVDGDAKAETINVKATKAVVKIDVKDATVTASKAVVEFKESKTSLKTAEITVKSDGNITIEGGKIVIKGSAVEIC